LFRAFGLFFVFVMTVLPWAQTRAFGAEPPHVVLVTALDPEGHGLLGTVRGNTNDALEKIFRNRFEHSGYTLEVHHDVDATALWNVFHSPQNVAVFFVGHAAATRELGPGGGLQGEGIIADRDGNNLKDVFKTIHPNLRYLAVVGCKAQAIFDQFKKEGAYKNNPYLKIFSFDHVVDPFDYPVQTEFTGGLTQAANHGLEVLSVPRTYDELFTYTGPCEKQDPQTLPGKSLEQCRAYYVSHRDIEMKPEFAQGLAPACYATQGIAIQVKRVISSDAKADAIKPLRLVAQDHILGIFPEGRPGETQTLDLYFDAGSIQSVEDLKITADTGASLSEKIYIGKLEIAPSWQGGEWKPIVSASGVPLGVTRNIYRYSGPLKNLPRVQYQPFSCDLR
jgi:hypothetical protein